MKKIQIDKKEMLKFINETKQVTGYTPSTYIIRQKFKLSNSTLIRFLHLLEKEGEIVINKGKKVNNYYNLKI